MTKREIEQEYENCYAQMYPDIPPEKFWNYDPNYKVIETPDGYWIPVKELNDPEHGWITHLATKCWFSKRIQIELFRKLDEVLRMPHPCGPKGQ